MHKYKHKFIFVSKNNDFRITPEMANALPFEFQHVSDNKEPLSVVYNSVLDSDTESDFVYFLHADVKLDLNGLVTHIESVADKYDVIGLCGCSNFNVSQSPLNWYCGSIPFPNTRWGCVTHGEIGNQISYFSERYPDITDHEVACIDGLCIIMSRKAINAGLRFDKDVGDFDFYDTDISMQAILKYGLKLGVVIRRDLMHFSIGRSILSPDFLKNEVKFRAKWGFKLPTGTKLPEQVK